MTNDRQDRPTPATGRRVLFLNGNETARPYRVAPLGLAFVASATERAGYHVRFADFPFSSLQRRRLRRDLQRWQPHYLAVGIRNLDNSDFHALETYLAGPAGLIAIARQTLPRLKVIVGGPAGTVEPGKVVEQTGCDHLILGEGEEALPALLRQLDTGHTPPPIVGSDDRHTPFRVADTTSLPAPQLHRWVTRLRPYLEGDAGYPIQTKRGCPLKCTYCTYARIEGTRYRFLQPAAVADEIEGAMNRGVRDFEFVDSTFNLPPSHALAILDEIQRRKLLANYVGTGLNPSRLPDELLAGMRRVGFRSAILTAESASNAMLASYRKNYSRETLHAAAAGLQRHDLTALWVFLIGGPGETRSTVAETLDFISQAVHPPHAVYLTSGVRVYPGSAIDDDLNAGRYQAANWRYRVDHPDIPFFYSEATPPDWLEARLRRFQQDHPHVMLSCEGHAATTQLALRLMRHLPLRKPYWQYIPVLNRARRWLPRRTATPDSHPTPTPAPASVECPAPSP